MSTIRVDHIVPLTGTTVTVSGSLNVATASYAVTASYAMNGGGGGGGAISIYSQGILQGTSSKVNFYGPGVEAYIGEIDPTIAIANIQAGVWVTVPDIYNSPTVREFEFASGAVFLTASENYPGYERAIVRSANLTSISSDILPSTNGIYSLGDMQKQFFDLWVTDSVKIGSTLLQNSDFTLTSNEPLVTPAISADIANIGSVNIIEDTISVDQGAVSEYSLNPPIVKVGSGLKVLGSIYGEKYILVNGAGTPTENGVELQAAYDYAKELRLANPPSPYTDGSGYLQTDPNDRITVVISPGEYSFPNGPFIIDTSNIDVVSLTGNPDVYISTPLEPTPGNPTYASVWVKELPTANSYNLMRNVTVKGINTGEYQFRVGIYDSTILIENCKGGDYSFAIGLAQDYSPLHMNPGYQLQAVFKNCVGGDYSFHPYTGQNSCTYIDCTGGDYSFALEIYGAGGGYLYKNCKAGSYSFGYYSRADLYGRHENCTGGDFCFGSSPNGGFSPLNSGDYINCTARTYSFGAYNANYGRFIGCTAGSDSFVSTSGTNNGMIINCMAAQGASTLFSSSGQGIIRNCINPSGALVNS